MSLHIRPSKLAHFRLFAARVVQPGGEYRVSTCPSPHSPFLAAIGKVKVRVDFPLETRNPNLKTHAHGPTRMSADAHSGNEKQTPPALVLQKSDCQADVFWAGSRHCFAYHRFGRIDFSLSRRGATGPRLQLGGEKETTGKCQRRLPIYPHPGSPECSPITERPANLAAMPTTITEIFRDS